MTRLPARRLERPARGGYVMLVALLLIAVLAVIGATSLSIAGVDERIAYHNRKHMMVLNTAAAGIEHARFELQSEDPADEGYDTGGDTGADLVTAEEAEALFGGTLYAHNLGQYTVDATFIRCGNPPPGYSSEIGRSHFRSDFWMVSSTARMQNTAGVVANETRASTASMVRKVVRGNCRIR